MTRQSEFHDYLNALRARLGKRRRLLGIAATIAIMTLLSVVIAFALSRAGFPDDGVWFGRAVLVAGLIVAGWRLVLEPLRQLEREPGAAIEAQVPAFDGRANTFDSYHDSKNPLRELLAEDALQIAETYSPEVVVPQRELHRGWTLCAAGSLLFVMLAAIGPYGVSYGIRDLWVGWAMPNLLPPQSFAVVPGDSGIRLGGNLAVSATPQGFDPTNANIVARFGSGEWQDVEMRAGDDDFAFTFYSVRQSVEYYVRSGSVRSPTYSVAVVDLPRVESLALRYIFPEWTGREDEIRDPGGDIRAIADTRVEVTITTDRPMSDGSLVIDGVPVSFAVDETTATASFDVEDDGVYFAAADVGGEQIRLTDDYFIQVAEDGAPTIEFARPGRDWSASRIEEVTAEIVAEDDIRVESLELNYSVNGSDWNTVELDPSAETPTHIFMLEELGEGAPLSPGDLVAYYAVATDRERSAQTDIFFVDVQPFNRRYLQASGGGGAGGAGGSPESEISQRQREIIISTWNLVREESNPDRNDDAYVSDNAALLSRLQQTLKEQAETLAARVEARQLALADPRIEQFVEHLRAAAGAMEPAAEELAALDLPDALLSEQAALKHLLAAEAVYTDINVTQQANNRAAGGGQAGRDLSEMFELEMDLEKNQYETGSQASPEAPNEALDNIADELADLARRQEQLARGQQDAGQALPEERWQQDRLQRELQELRAQLEQMQGQQGGTESSNRQIADLQRRLESAARAMEEANAEEAANQLEGAQASAEEARREMQQEQFESLASRANEIVESQADIEAALQEAVRRALDAQEDDASFDSGLTWEQEIELANAKRNLLAELGSLSVDTAQAVDDIQAEQPETANDVREALDDVAEQQIEARLSIGAEYIEQGEAAFVASSESIITEALRGLERSLENAADTMVSTARGGPRERDSLERALAEATELREALADGAQGEGDQELAGDAQGLAGAVDEAIRGGGRLRAGSADNLQRLADELRIRGGGRDAAAIAEEMRRTLVVVEQLELELQRASRSNDAVRSAEPVVVSDEHREMVAEYYRRLGEEDATE
jgi:hypothetical protein